MSFLAGTVTRAVTNRLALSERATAAKARFKRDFDLGLRQRADRDVKSRRAASSTWISNPRWRGCSTGGGPETSEIAGGGNRAPRHVQKKSRLIARFSLNMGGALSARLLDRPPAAIFCGSMAAVICASKKWRYTTR